MQGETQVTDLIWEIFDEPGSELPLAVATRVNGFEQH
jgi:hypothetical protein